MAIKLADPMHPAAELVPGRGHIDQILDDAGTAILLGWWFPVGVEVQTGFSCRVNGADTPVLEQRLGLESPDLAAGFGWHSGARAARFAVRVGGPSTSWPAHTRVELVPQMIDGRSGLPLFSVAAPRTAMPPEEKVDRIGGAYLLHAMDFLSYFTTFGGLSPGGAVLDVGCGVGRMAFGLSTWLGPAGRYLGFDVMPDAVAVARQTIGSHFANFAFEHIDVANDMYNPAGKVQAESLVFPAADRSVDLAIMTSVITHVMPAVVRHYFAETARVLAPGGRALITAFAMDDHAAACVAEGHARIGLRRDDAAQCWVAATGTPEVTVAYTFAELRQWMEAAGLRIERTFAGQWSGRFPSLRFQDMFVVGLA